MEWVRENGIFDIVFNEKDHHVQTIQRAEALIRFFVEKNDFKEEDLKKFWAAWEWDDEIKREIYRIICQCSTPMKPELILLFLNLISDIPYSEMIPEEVEVIFKLGENSTGKSEFSKRSGDMLWEASTSNDTIESVSKLATTRICTLLKKWHYSVAEKFFTGILENLKGFKAGLESLEIFKTIVFDIKYKPQFLKEGEEPPPCKFTDSAEAI